MQHTSDNAEGVSRPFFSKEQVYAFSQPPSDAAVNQVKKQGSNQDYLPGEYVRLLLNQYIGAGMYDLEVALSGALHIETVQKDKWEEKKVTGKIENVAVTANVAVTIVIYASDGSGRTRRYSAVGSHTMYGLAEAGAGAIIANAIKSAETSGLKRAVQPLGRAFGLDLKNKVTKAMMPPGIPHFRRMLDDAEAAKAKKSAGVDDTAVAISPSQTGQETQERQESVEGDGVASNRETTAPKGDQKTNAQPKAGAVKPTQEKAPVSGGRAVETATTADAVIAEKSAAKPAEPAAEVKAAAPADPASGEGKPAAADETEWELTMTPSNYTQWVSCIKTMTKRVATMTSERELVSFARRNASLIGTLPFFPEEGDQPAKDFALRWRSVMARRYQSLGLDVPAQYAPAEAVKQTA